MDHRDLEGLSRFELRTGSDGRAQIRVFSDDGGVGLVVGNVDLGVGESAFFLLGYGSQPIRMAERAARRAGAARPAAGPRAAAELRARSPRHPQHVIVEVAAVHAVLFDVLQDLDLEPRRAQSPGEGAVA